MNQQIDTDLDQADEEILTDTVSDEALEAAAGTERGAAAQFLPPPTLLRGPMCSVNGRYEHHHQPLRPDSCRPAPFRAWTPYGARRTVPDAFSSGRVGGYWPLSILTGPF